MKKNTKNYVKLLLGLLILPAITLAQTTEIENLKAQIQSMQGEKKALIEQVKNEEITKEEAKEIWAQKIQALRTQKETIFENQFQNLKTKFEERIAENPERAEKIQEQLDFITKERAERKAFAEDLRDKVKNGEVTKEEAKELRKEKIESLKEIRKERRESIKEDIKTNRQTLQNSLQNGTLNEEEFRKMIQERQEALKVQLEEKIGSLKETDPEKYEALIKRQKELQEAVQEKLQESLKNGLPTKEEIQKLIQERQSNRNEKLETLKETDPEKYEEIIQRQNEQQADRTQRQEIQKEFRNDLRGINATRKEVQSLRQERRKATNQTGTNSDGTLNNAAIE